MFLEDSVGYGKPQPGAFAHGFGCEERFEQMVNMLWCDS